MIKKLGPIGIAIVIALFAAQSAMGQATFYGGNMLGTLNVTPTQNLNVAAGTITATQRVTAADADTIKFTTNTQRGAITNAFAVTRNATGRVDNFTVTSRQNVAATDAAVGIGAGLQQGTNAFSITSIDTSSLTGAAVGSTGQFDLPRPGITACFLATGAAVGSTGQFDAETGSDATITFTNYDQSSRLALSAPQGTMTQRDQVTYGVISPGTDARPLTMTASGGAKGSSEFKGTISGAMLNEQEFSGILPASAGIYSGFQRTQMGTPATPITIINTTVKVATSP